MDKLYTIKEVCDMLRISRATLYRVMRKYRLSPIKIGGKVLFTESELERFMRELKGET